MDDFSFDSVIDKVKAPASILHFSAPPEVLFHGQGKKSQRNIFKHQTYNSREIEKLRRLKEMISKQKLRIPSDWDDSELLKFVYGSGFKTRQSFKDLKSCLESRAEVFPQDIRLIYPKILEILKTGPLYFHGRDHNFRPLLVMNFAKFNLKKYSFEQYLQSACFVLEFVGKYALFPGKVENWMCISDLGFQGLGDLPINTLRKITKVLQDVFKCRLAYSAMINVPKSVYFIYSLLKPFLDEVTIDKISIAKDNVATNIISHFNPYQIEERYGGKAKNLEVFWPPFFPDCPVEIDGGDAHIKVESVKSSLVAVESAEVDPAEASFKSQPAIDTQEINQDSDYQLKENKKTKRHKKRREKERKKKKQAKQLEAASDIAANQESFDIAANQESLDIAQNQKSLEVFETDLIVKKKKRNKQGNERSEDYEDVFKKAEIPCLTNDGNLENQGLSKSVDTGLDLGHINLEKEGKTILCGFDVENRCVIT